VWGRGVSKERVGGRIEAVGEGELERDPRQLTLIAFDSSGEVGQRRWVSFPLPS
jgi:hypothetical protein